MHPNTISWLSFVLAIAAGLTVYLSPSYYWILLPIASVLVLLSGLFDAIDGKVARLTGKASKKGDLLDHILDRYSDVFMIGGIAFSAWCSPYIGMLALIGVLLTSYMGTQAQAIGAGRLYAGLLGRADRVVLLTLAPVVQMLFVVLLAPFSSPGVGAPLYTWGWINFGYGVSLSIFEIVMLWFAVVGNITAVQRALTIWKRL